MHCTGLQGGLGGCKACWGGGVGWLAGWLTVTCLAMGLLYVRALGVRGWVAGMLLLVLLLPACLLCVRACA